MFCLGGYLSRPLRAAYRRNHPEEHPLNAQAAMVGFRICGFGITGLLRRLRISGLAHIPGRDQHRYVDGSRWRHRRVEHAIAVGVFFVLAYFGSVTFPDRPGGFSGGPAEHPVQARRIARAPHHPRWVRISQRIVSLSGVDADGAELAQPAHRARASISRLVGENGQGKTTLVKLMARLYDPTAGAILLDGVDLRDYRMEDLHHQIGVIFQDFVRYDLPPG